MSKLLVSGDRRYLTISHGDKSKEKPMSKLTAIPPKKAKPKKPKILIYGKAGVGKTWASLDFPNVYYIDTESGANGSHYTDKLANSGGAYFGIEQGSLDFETVIDQVKALATEKHGYKTVVIDSFSKVYMTAISTEYDNIIRSGKKAEYAVEKKPAAAYSRRLLSWVTRLDMNVILICHEKSEWKNGEQIGDTYDGYEKLGYELDLSLHIVKAGLTRNAWVKKSRLEEFQEGGFFPWSYAEFSARYGQEVIEQASENIVLATKEQLDNLRHLLSVIKLPEGQEQKWLVKAQAESWDEVSSHYMGFLLAHINKQYLNNNKEGE